MTDRVHSLTLVLAEDLRTDDVQSLIDAVLHLKGVASVGSNISDVGQYVAEERALAKLRDQMRDILYPKFKT